MTSNLILAIETSCDETAVSIANEEGEIIINKVSSQIKLHSEHGGVVPEIASRNHNTKLVLMLSEIFKSNNIEWENIKVLAATSGPGLSSSLLIGSTTAKSIAATLNCPFYGINHLEGHMFSPFIGFTNLIEPHLALIVSGGHTLIVKVKEFGSYEIIGSTKDDAAGEAFDKTGKMLGLNYPGGPKVAKLAECGDKEKFNLPRSMINSKDFNFSFSGLKTSVKYLLEKQTKPLKSNFINDVCASFQEAVVDILVHKITFAAKENNYKAIGVSGGVSANKRLIERIKFKCNEENIKCFIANNYFTGDNAAMIAFVASLKNKFSFPSSPLNYDIDPNLTL